MLHCKICCVLTSGHPDPEAKAIDVMRGERLLLRHENYKVMPYEFPGRRRRYLHIRRRHRGGPKLNFKPCNTAARGRNLSHYMVSGFALTLLSFFFR